MKAKLSKLYANLGYTFKQASWVESALTHRSVKGENNERLEFLGDSIVNFLVAEALYKRYPKASEGKLSRIRANLVNRDTMAEIAKKLQLGDFLKLGPGELKSGGHHRDSILSDALEAVIAAIYLDSDMVICSEVVMTWYEEPMSIIRKTRVEKDPKTLLQEYLQGHKLPLPQYQIVKILGEAHEQTFHIHCEVEGIPHISMGMGSSRRRAEQHAAESFLTYVREHG